MADCIFTQNGDNNVQIGDMTGMPYGVNTALKWALGQNFQSVAAQYARILAYEVDRQAKDSATLRDDLATARAESARLQSENETLWEEVGYTDGDQVDAARFFHEQKDAITALQAEAERMRAENEAYKADVEAGRMVRLPCQIGDVVYTIKERYFDCGECRYSDESKYDAKIDRYCCDMEDRRCPLEIQERIVRGFDIGENGVSDPGEWGYEGLEYFSGADGKWHLTREAAEQACAALERGKEGIDG